MKKKTSLIIWIVILAVLSVLYVCVTKMDKGEEETVDEEAAQKVLTWSSSEVYAISFDLDGSTVRFVKGEDGWMLDGQADFKVNSQTINEAISGLTTMESARTLEGVTDLKEYGLEDPMKVVVLEKEDGTTFTICFGDINESTANSYVCLEDDLSKVYTVPYSNERAFEGTLEDFRQTEEETEDAETASTAEVTETTTAETESAETESAEESTEASTAEE